MTWIATAAAPATLGAEIDFVDIDPRTYNLDPNQLAEAITPKTKAIIPVHLYGQCCDMDPILEIANEHGIAVVEDACQAVGSRYKDRMAGSMGVAGCFSFHEQKNMSTLGEGGMIVTDDPDLYERIALYRSHCTRVHGRSTKYCQLDEAKFPMGKTFWLQDFDDTGYNFRMTDIQAAVGIVQLKKLDELNQRRIDNAAYLTEALSDVPGLTVPTVMPGCKHTFHLYPGHDRRGPFRHEQGRFRICDAVRARHQGRHALQPLALVDGVSKTGLQARPIPERGESR